jgi:hypothetical protein
MKFLPVICDTLLITATRSASLKFNVTSSAVAWWLSSNRPSEHIMVTSFLINDDLKLEVLGLFGAVAHERYRDTFRRGQRL